jgi:ABC-type Mn2+/Zn2+ transport system ATPase subunit
VRPQHGSVVRQPGVAVSYVPQLETVDWNFPVTVGECVLMSRPTRRLLPWATPVEKARSPRSSSGSASASWRTATSASCPGVSSSGCSSPSAAAATVAAAARRADLRVDVGTRHEVLPPARRPQPRRPRIVLTTHDLNGMAAHLPHLVALHRRVVAAGPPEQVIVPDVLERTFGARMEVLQHLGMPVVVDGGERVGRGTVLR